MVHKILVSNIGSTSTKLAVYMWYEKAVQPEYAHSQGIKFLRFSFRMTKTNI